jgi:hypothetical protein
LKKMAPAGNVPPAMAKTIAKMFVQSVGTGSSLMRRLADVVVVVGSARLVSVIVKPAGAPLKVNDAYMLLPGAGGSVSVPFCGMLNVSGVAVAVGDGVG